MGADRISGGLDELYSEAILDHARTPRWETPIDRPDGTGDAVNPFCGDEAHCQFAVDGPVIQGVGMQTVGCSINRAAGSMLAQALSGLSLDGAGALAADYRALMAGEDLGDERLGGLGELALMAGVRRFPVRVKCALLALTAVEDALPFLTPTGQ